MTLEPENSESTESKESEAPKILGLPTVEYFIKTYARSNGNDKKAAKVFKDYETGEKISRLKRELGFITQGKVPDEVCLKILGRGRIGTFETSKRWAMFINGFLR